VNRIRQLWRRALDHLPIDGFYFGRPLVLFQSDDWGRVGVRDKEGLEQLRLAGIALGERPYDFYALENSDDLIAIAATLKHHRDSSGQHPCLGMNFVVANLNCAAAIVNPAAGLRFLQLAEELPEGWQRPNLLEAYQRGIADGIFRPALHGTSHFCTPAVERNRASRGERAQLLETFWRSGTPYIHWRMPWVGYEYWDPEQPKDKRFLSAEVQREMIGHSIGGFARLFSALPRSACAPGYRANDDTHRAWAQHGIRVAQNGPETVLPPHFDRHQLLHLSRAVEFEPAVDSSFSLEQCLEKAERCFRRGIPAIVSVHAINFHSTLRDFRTATLQVLDQFLTGLETRHSDLLYLCDEDLYDLVERGNYRASGRDVTVTVTRKKFSRADTRQL